MVTRTNRLLQAIRDCALLLISVVLMSTSYGKWIDEPAHYVVFGIAALLFTLSAVNIILIIRNVKRKGYYYFNAIIQLLPSFILAGFIPPLGIPLLLVNIIILITLRKEKKHE